MRLEDRYGYAFLLSGYITSSLLNFSQEGFILYIIALTFFLRSAYLQINKKRGKK